MTDFVRFPGWLLAIASPAMLTVPVLLLLSAAWIGGWRMALSGSISWWHPPPDLGPGVWRHRRRMSMCFWGVVTCTTLLQVIMIFRQSK